MVEPADSESAHEVHDISDDHEAKAHDALRNLGHGLVGLGGRVEGEDAPRGRPVVFQGGSSDDVNLAFEDVGLGALLSDCRICQVA